jgi:metallo-beta-lactamase family protein
VFRKNAQVFDEETKAYILKGNNPLDFKNLIFTRSTEESQALNNDRSPKVIISASGMCEAGRIRHHLKHNLWDARNSVVFVGYQAEGTLGKLLVGGAKEITLFGEEIQVNAEIYNLEGFSGHADQRGLLDWLGGFQVKPKQIFLVHGEHDSKHDFAEKVKEVYGYEPVVIEGNSEFELETGKLLSKEEIIREAIDTEDIENLKGKIEEVEKNLKGLLESARGAVSTSISPERLQSINNTVLELEKASLNLGSSVTAENRSSKPLSEQ